MARVDAALRVTLVFSARPDEVSLIELQLPPGATVADALRAAAVDADASRWSVGVWGRVAPLDRALHDGDRVELCRALTVDPKEARRLRYKRQRAAR